MAKSTKQNYSLDTKKKIITATISKLDEEEKEIVQMYINAGYTLHKGKSNPWNKKSIAKWLKDNVGESESKKFEKDCESLGWVSARKSFFDKYDSKTREEIESKNKAE